MNNVREVNRINERELDLAVEGGASWHDDYKDSAYIFVGNLDKRLTEGDVITIFSQYGEVLDINLPKIPEGGLQRDRNGGGDEPPSGSGSGSNDRERQQQQQQQAGKPGDRRGFGFLLYEDQKSTILAVDNLNGFNLLGRTIRVDHVKDYKMPGARKKEEEGEVLEPSRNAAPTMIKDPQGSRDSDDEEEEDEEGDLDLADPMASYIAASKREKGRSREDKEERRLRKEEKRRRRDEKERKKRKSEEGGRREIEDSSKRHRSNHDDYDERKRGSSHRSERERGDSRSHRSSRDAYGEDREKSRRSEETRSRDHRDEYRDVHRRDRESYDARRDYDHRSDERDRYRERDYDRRR